jgi:hypothetical protein
MKLKEYLRKINADKNIVFILKMLYEPRRWFSVTDLSTSGCKYADTQKSLNMLVKENILLARTAEWITGKGVELAKGKKYKVNITNNFIKMLEMEIK